MQEMCGCALNITFTDSFETWNSSERDKGLPVIILWDLASLNAKDMYRNMTDMKRTK